MGIFLRDSGKYYCKVAGQPAKICIQPGQPTGANCDPLPPTGDSGCSIGSMHGTVYQKGFFGQLVAANKRSNNQSFNSWKKQQAKKTGSMSNFTGDDLKKLNTAKGIGALAGAAVLGVTGNLVGKKVKVKAFGKHNRLIMTLGGIAVGAAAGYAIGSTIKPKPVITVPEANTKGPNSEAGSVCKETGPLPKMACSQQYDPVCGCDGKTYGNACSATVAGIKKFEKGECKK